MPCRQLDGALGGLGTSLDTLALAIDPLGGESTDGADDYVLLRLGAHAGHLDSRPADGFSVEIHPM